MPKNPPIRPERVPRPNCTGSVGRTCTLPLKQKNHMLATMSTTPSTRLRRASGAKATAITARPETARKVRRMGNSRRQGMKRLRRKVMKSEVTRASMPESAVASP